MRTTSEIDKEIARLTEQKDNLLKEKQEFEKLSKVEKIASYLHENFCTSNHCDQCSWLYENNTTDWNRQGSSHCKWKLKAIDLLGWMCDND